MRGIYTQSDDTVFMIDEQSDVHDRENLLHTGLGMIHDLILISSK